MSLRFVKPTSSPHVLSYTRFFFYVHFIPDKAYVLLILLKCGNACVFHQLVIHLGWRTYDVVGVVLKCPL